MQQDVDKHVKLFQLIPTNRGAGSRSNVLPVGRYLVGRADSCDIVIPSNGVSAVHAVLEITPRGTKVYDMNSRNGTFVNGERVVAQDIKEEERISFGIVEFSFKKYVSQPDLPPVLSTLEPIKGDASLLKTTIPIVAPELPKADAPKANLPKVQPPIEDEIPYIIYPLAADPQSDYSEYIFEDTVDLYPIFKYEINQQSMEVIILFRDQVYSVDYLPEKDGVYQIAGLTNKEKEIEFPYLGKQEKVAFIEMNKGNCVVNQLHKYDLLHLVGDKVVTANDGVVNLQGNDIVKLTSGELEIYVRRVSSPPKVKAAPFFRRDKALWKYMLVIFLLVLLPVLALNLYEVDEKLMDEKDPERIATILYKQKLNVVKNRAVESSKKKPVKKQSAPKKPVVKKSTPKKTKATSRKSIVKTKKTTKNPGAKAAKKVQKVKRAKNPAPRKNNRSKIAKAVTKSTNKAKAPRTRRANVRTKSVGRVDVYKSFDFKSSVSSLMAKGGSLRGAKTAKTSSSNVSNAQISGGVATNLNKAAIGTEVGSLAGSTEGKLGESKGTKGLSAKTGVYTAGIPSETVVLGSMDPDVIRRILRDNIPFFRSCYQKELDRNSSSRVSGTIKLVFSIGASGHVSRAGVDGRTKLVPKVKKCVVGVLRGIKFPRPLGGGTVDVKQPFNFYPKRI